MSTTTQMLSTRARRAGCGRRGFLALAAGAATVALSGQKARAKTLRQQIEAEVGTGETLGWLVRHENSATTQRHGLPEGFCVAWTRNRGHYLWVTRETEGGPITGGILWLPEAYTDAHVRACVGFYMRQGALQG